MSQEKGTGKQSFQLGLLTFVHFLADCANNAVPGFLVAAMAYFTLDLSYGVGLLSAMGIGCNLLHEDIETMKTVGDVAEYIQNRT